MAWKEALRLKYLTSTVNRHPDFELFQGTTSRKTFFRMKVIFKIRYFLRIKVRYLTSDFQSSRAFPQVPIDSYWSYKGVWEGLEGCTCFHANNHKKGLFQIQSS